MTCRVGCLIGEERKMWSATACHALTPTCLGVALLLLSCSADDAPLPTIHWPKGQVNIARAARLAQTVLIEIVEEKMPLASPPGSAPERKAVPPRRVLIRDRQTIAQIVQALDREVPLGVPPACIRQYAVRFHLSNNVVGEFDYMCEPVGPASFIWGQLSDKSFDLGGWAILPEQFRILVDTHLAMGAIQDIVSAERQFQVAAILDANKNGVGEYGTRKDLEQAGLIETLPDGHRFEVVVTGDPARDEKAFFVYAVPTVYAPSPPPWRIPGFVWAQWLRLRPPFIGYTFVSDQTDEIRWADLRAPRTVTLEETRTWEKIRW